MVDDKKITLSSTYQIAALKPEVDKIMLTTDTLREYFPAPTRPER